MRRAVGLPAEPGLLVRSVERSSPAGRAGLEPGDLVQETDGRPVRSLTDLQRAIEGGLKELAVLRGVERRRVRVKLEPVERA